MPDEMTSARTRTYGARSFVRDVVVVAIGLALVCGSFVPAIHFGLSVDDSPVEKRGVAVAKECVAAGLFGPRPWGWWETCQAEVRWENGGTDRVEFTHSQLTSGDIDRETDVVQRRNNKGTGKGSYLQLYRADFESKPVVGWLLFGPMLFVGSLMVMFTVFRWVNVVRGWFGLAPWGTKGDEK